MLLCISVTFGQRTTVYSDCHCSSRLSSARLRNVVKMKMHNYTKFPVFCLTWFTVLYLFSFISLAENVETCVQFLAVNLSLRASSALPKNRRESCQSSLEKIWLGGLTPPNPTPSRFSNWSLCGWREKEGEWRGERRWEMSNGQHTVANICHCPQNTPLSPDLTPLSSPLVAVAHTGHRNNRTFQYILLQISAVRQITIRRHWWQCITVVQLGNVCVRIPDERAR